MFTEPSPSEAASERTARSTSSLTTFSDLRAQVSSILDPQVDLAPRPMPLPPPLPPVRRSDVAASSSLEETSRRQEEEQATAATRLQQQYRRSEAQLQDRRAREKAAKDAAAGIAGGLERNRLHPDAVLAIEHVLQEQTFGQPNGRLRLDFLQLRGDSRSRHPMRGGKQGKSKLPACPNLDGSPVQWSNKAR
jgi:hypothetical protein